MIIPSAPWKQLELSFPYTNQRSTMPDSDRHLQEDLLDTALPDGWKLKEWKDGYYARHPEAGQTDDYPDPERVSQEAHVKHQQWINDKEDTAAEAPPSDAPTEALTKKESGPVEVLDADNGEYVTVTPELRAEAQHAVTQIQAAALVTAYWISRVYDQRLYVALDCTSKKDFVERYCSFGMSQARRYAKVGRRMGQFLPAPNRGELPEPETDTDEDGASVPDSLKGLPMSKMEQLTRLDDDDLNDYISEGEWTGPDGEAYTRDDVMDMARSELSDLVAQRTERLSGALEKEKEKRQNFEELAKKRKEERDALKDEIEENEEKISAARDAELKYGKKASLLEDKRNMHAEAMAHLDAFMRTFPQIGIDTDDPEADQIKIVQMMETLNRAQGAFYEDYAEVLIQNGGA